MQAAIVWRIVILDFGIVSDFDIRISNFSVIMPHRIEAKLRWMAEK